MGIFDRAKSAWNAFRSTADPVTDFGLGSPTYGSISDASNMARSRMPMFNDRTIVTSIYNRIGIDVADVVFRHIRLDEMGRYLEDVDSHLNAALIFEPNLDQGPRAFRQDIAMTLFGEGVAAIVPVDTAVNPQTNQTFDIYTLRVGRIVRWYPQHIRVSLYNEKTGKREEITLEKRMVAIVENPLYCVMNEPNSTLQRLIRKLALLDAVDEQSSSGKLDLIIQLPYVIKSEARRLQAEKRREEIEFQLKGSKYGIAYADGTEKITQLNRPTENNLLKQVEYLTNMLYGQLGITEAVMNGTADESTMNNFFHRTVGPIADSIKEALQRAFLDQTTKERIHYFKDPFKFVPLKDLAEIVDKFTRNEVLTSNEIRGFVGIQPSRDPKADQLINSNLKVADTRVPPDTVPPAGLPFERNSQNGSKVPA